MSQTDTSITYQTVEFGTKVVGFRSDGNRRNWMFGRDKDGYRGLPLWVRFCPTPLPQHLHSNIHKLDHTASSNVAIILSQYNTVRPRPRPPPHLQQRAGVPRYTPHATSYSWNSGPGQYPITHPADR